MGLHCESEANPQPFDMPPLVFFLPNGIGDVLMAVPALRRFIEVRGLKGIRVVVGGSVHKDVLHHFIDPSLKCLIRYDARRFPNLRLWLKLFFWGGFLVSAPLLSKKKLHLMYFASLFRKVQVPASFGAKSFFRLQPSALSLNSYNGHQVNYFVQFLAEIEPCMKTSRVDYRELALPRVGCHIPPSSKPIKRIAVGMSCGEKERHKIPPPAFFADLLNVVSKDQAIEVLIIGSSSDQPLIDKFCAEIQPHIPFEFAIGLSIDALILKLAACDLGISGTTGQGHMMAAAGLPMLVLAGVTSPTESGPYVERAEILQHRYVCGPCYQETYSFGCQIVRCMETLDVRLGAQMIIQLLNDHLCGQNWMHKVAKRPPVPVHRIEDIHKRPQIEWTASL